MYVMCFIVEDLFCFQAEDGIRDIGVTGVQTCALPIWLSVRIKSTWTCNAVLDNIRRSWVSVSSFLGIKFRMASFKGRISCVSARCVVMVKICSFSNILLAGRSLGITKGIDRKSTRLNSSHANISYAVFCLKK